MGGKRKVALFLVRVSQRVFVFYSLQLFTARDFSKSVALDFQFPSPSTSHGFNAESTHSLGRT